MNLSLYAGRLGELPKTVELPWDYFNVRGCFLDCRGPLTISATSSWGVGVRILTESHDLSQWPKLGPSVPYGVTVEDGAWIGSYALLTGCKIGEHAIVAAGSVVRGQVVSPLTMVAGDPARVIARWEDGRWNYLPAGKSGFKQDLD
jgi:acetyltransferase-like isoleucine patch superfamily enzyme